MVYEAGIWKEALGFAAFVYMLVCLHSAWAGYLF